MDAEAAEREWESTTGSPARWIQGIAAIVVFVVIIAVALWLFSPSPSSSSQTPISSGPAYPVNVTVINLTSPDNVCGLNGTTEPGFHGVTNAFSGETWHITGPPGGCTISDISAVTGGFMIPPSVYLPQSIGAGQTGNVSVSFDMLGLGGPYTGPLVVSVT